MPFFADCPVTELKNQAQSLFNYQKESGLSLTRNVTLRPTLRLVVFIIVDIFRCLTTFKERSSNIVTTK